MFVVFVWFQTTTGGMEGEKRSFKDKMKFFEQEIAEQKTVKPRANGTYQNHFVFWWVKERAK